MEELLDEFVAEAKEHLEKVEKHLLDMEKHPGLFDPEMIADIFRAVHSIKGASGFLGLKNIGELSHVMETLMSMVRSGELNPESRHIDALLKGRDVLMSMIGNVRNSDQTDIGPTVAVIRSAIDNAMSPEIRGQMETRIAVTDILDEPTGMEIRQFDLINIRKNFGKLFLLEYDLSDLEKKTGLSPVALVRKLLATGEILETKLDMTFLSLNQDLSTVPLKYKTLYTTDMDYQSVKELLELSDQEICEITPEGIKKVKGGGQTTDGGGQTTENRDQRAEAGDRKPEDGYQTAAEESREIKSDHLPKEEAPVQAFRPDEKIDNVRISVDVLDKLMRLAGELVLIRNQHLLSAAEFPSLRSLSQRLNTVTSEIQETIMQTRMQPIANLFSKVPRIVRDLSKKFSKTIALSMHGGEVELDKAILESLTDPMIHLIRNCCDHGIESPDERKQQGKSAEGSIEILAWHESGRINIRIRDNGRGIDPKKVISKAMKNRLTTDSDNLTGRDIFSLIFLPGFSTAEHVTEVSGRGVGLDVVKTAVEKIGGAVEVGSELGKGTEFLLKLPLTLAIIPCLMVTSGGYRYAVPQMNLEELVSLYDREVFSKIECAGNREVFRLRNKLLPLVRLNETLARKHPLTEDDFSAITEKYRQMGSNPENDKGSLKFAVVKAGTLRFGLIVDQITGTEEIVVKPMHPATRHLNIYSGAAIMGDGSAALILNIEGIGIHAGLDRGAVPEQAHGKIPETVPPDAEKQNSLLFTCGSDEQFAIPLSLIRRVERISVKNIERICNREFITINGASTFIVRIDQVLDVVPFPDEPEMSLILPKFMHRPAGILISKVADAAETPMVLNTDAFMADGLLGTAIIRGRMTLFPDIFRMIELAEPEWFARRRHASPPASGKHILLVEDTPFFRSLVRGYLEADKYVVVEAANGKEAIEKLNNRRFDMIISDLEMPVMNGFEFIRSLRKIPECRNIPAAALTALDSEADRQKAESAGFDKYFVKIDREELLTQIANMLNPSSRILQSAGMIPANS